MAFAFGVSAEIERNLISQRTKDALARRRAEGGLKEPYLEGFKEAKIAGTNLMAVKNELIEC